MKLWIVTVTCPPRRRERKSRINRWVVMASSHDEAIDQVDLFDREFYSKEGAVWKTREWEGTSFALPMHFGDVS